MKPSVSQARQLGQLLVAQVLRVVAGDDDVTRSGGIDAADEIEQRGLAAARWACDRNEVAFFDFERDAAERGHHDFAEVVLFDHIGDRNDAWHFLS